MTNSQDANASESASASPVVRCAIYARKSTEEGLFLHAVLQVYTHRAGQTLIEFLRNNSIRARGASDHESTNLSEVRRGFSR
jgi:hypothetical protein